MNNLKKEILEKIDKYGFDPELWSISNREVQKLERLSIDNIDYTPQDAKSFDEIKSINIIFCNKEYVKYTRRKK